MYMLTPTRWRPRAVAATLALSLAAVFALLSAGSASASALPTYQLSHFAGVAGSSGTASNSKFNEIYSMATDAAGDVYVADQGANTVDKITPSGQISVVAGGGSTSPTPGATIAATSANLYEPYGVAVDAAGDVYIADYGNYEVEKVTPAGQLSVIAGAPTGITAVVGSTYNATSVFMYPDGVAVDSAGNVYVADWDNSFVYKVTPSGQLTIIAGNGTYGQESNGVATSQPLGGANGIVVNAAGDVYFSDDHYSLVDEVTPAGQLTIVAGTGTAATPINGVAASSPLNQAWGLALDGAGDLYIADYGDGDVSAVTPDGRLTVIAGNGTSAAPTYGVPATTSSLNGPNGIASTAAGRLYVGDTGNYTVDLLLPNPPVNTSLPTVAGTVAVGSALTATQGTWTNVPILYGYQWQDCDSSGANCTSIAGATSASYTLTTSDRGHTLRVVVTAQNGAGSASADSLATALLPAPASTSTTTTTTTAGPGTASPASGGSETLGGTVGAHSATVSYEFQFGPDTSYGQTSAQGSLPASSLVQTVESTVQGLIPGTTYHFRLVVIGPDGQDTYGPDQTFTAAKVAPVRVRTHIHEYWEAAAPYVYLVKGHVKLSKGMPVKVAFRTGGKALIKVMRGGRLVASRTVRVTRRGTYRTSFTFDQAQLPGTGKVMFHISFLGNQQLLAKRGRSQLRFYGPSYVLLHRVYGFTASKKS